MYRALLSTSGFTLISRVTGFVRDIIMASVLPPGVQSDAFFVAFRLPNHFRTIFAEGAYNAAFVPLFTELKADGTRKADDFARNMMGWQVLIQLILLAVALFMMPWVVSLLAPGFTDEPEQMALAVDLTRITFGYLFCIAIVTHLGGVLNAQGKFWAAAAAPVLLNVFMSVALLVAVLFPSAAHAVSWGVLAGGFAEVALLMLAAGRAGIPVVPTTPRITGEVKEFFTRFVPATVGAAGVQLAMFADTIFASFLAAGAYSALYFADRINQLPMGVIAIALGTVLLPQVSKSIAAGDEKATNRAFNRATGVGLLLTLPCTVAFLVIPDVIMTGLFARGAFDLTAANAAASVLFAYAIGLPAFVMLRTVTPLFHGRGDTRTPVYATGVSIAVNLALKGGFVVVLAMGVEGLALATAIGTWVNLIVLCVVGWRLKFVVFDRQLIQQVLPMMTASVYAGLVAGLMLQPTLKVLGGVSMFQAEFHLALMALIGLGSYGVGLFASGWRR